MAWEELAKEAKEAVRAQLLQDQGSWCCYCYRNISGDSSDHIEHIVPQSDENRYDWANLALACEGGNRSGRAKTCDHAKLETRLEVVHPYGSPVPEHVRLKGDGQLILTSPQAKRDVEGTLNLNARHLRDARRSALLAAQPALKTKGTSKRRASANRWSARRLQQVRADLVAQGDTVEFLPFLLSWLDRQIERRA